MNSQQDSPRRRRAAATPAVTDSDGAPFRRLRTGRRRAEPTAPFDQHRPAPEAPEEASEGDLATPVVEPSPTPVAASAHASATVEETDEAEPELGHDDETHVAEAAHEEPNAIFGPSDADEHADEPFNEAHDYTLNHPPELAAALAQRKKRRRRRNIIMVSVFTIFVLALTAAGLFINGLLNTEPADFEGPGEGEVTFVVAQGWGPNRVGDELVSQGIVASREAFLQALSSADSENKEVHPGEYPLQTKLPARDAADVLLGVGSAPVAYLAINQNARLPAALEAIAEATGIELPELQELATAPETFGLDSSYENIEGFLHPGEYRFPVDSSAEEVLQMLVDATRDKLAAAGASDPDDAYRALTIASILQGEARTDDYAVVAGAIENRLKPDNRETGGLLQVDSSVIYGLDRYTLEFTAEEKADESNPYNTYQHAGLPPTPIGSPGDAAIEAAVNPDENDYYYWVTVNIATGETKFAESYSEHRRNQQEYRDYCAANPGVCG
ncbi:endolytic transglycosylase MltG [Zhihengliuella halotolerans]|uniref:endolytic transglycosylase MltG n=1 Tax=Zhihengliuella halotolerans TaxID=370736 RepID=UPI0011AF6CEE|nr:endolytic transglycosylase MltG [Zhihengliuella halotolerans]